MLRHALTSVAPLMMLLGIQSAHADSIACSFTTESGAIGSTALASSGGTLLEICLLYTSDAADE